MRATTHRQRGFTLIELCLAMLVTSLVMGAMAAFSMAMVAAWRNAEQEQTLTLTGTQVVARINDAVCKARQLGAVRTGAMTNPVNGAAAMLWVADTNNDGLIQGAEVAMIIHDVSSNEIWMYPSGQGDAVAAWTWATFNNAAVFANFAVGRTHYALARNVDGATFQASGTGSTSQRPTLQYALRLRNSAGVTTSRQVAQYGTATLRAPLAQPS